MKSRKGNILLSVLLSLMVFTVIFSFLALSTNTKRTAERRAGRYLDTYTFETCLDIGVQSFTDDICAVNVKYPKTPLNNTIFIYDEAVKSIERKVSDSELNYIAKDLSALTNGSGITNEEIKKELSRKAKGAEFRLKLLNGISGDFQHPDGILNFMSGDILYLQPIEIKGSVKVKGQTISKNYSITGLYCDVEHKNGDIVLKINSGEAVISCENISLK